MVRKKHEDSDVSMEALRGMLDQAEVALVKARDDLKAEQDAHLATGDRLQGYIDVVERELVAANAEIAGLQGKLAANRDLLNEVRGGGYKDLKHELARALGKLEAWQQAHLDVAMVLADMDPVPDVTKTDFIQKRLEKPTSDDSAFAADLLRAVDQGQCDVSHAVATDRDGAEGMEP